MTVEQTITSAVDDVPTVKYASRDASSEASRWLHRTRRLSAWSVSPHCVTASQHA